MGVLGSLASILALFGIGPFKLGPAKTFLALALSLLVVVAAALVLGSENRTSNRASSIAQTSLVLLVLFQVVVIVYLFLLGQPGVVAADRSLTFRDPTDREEVRSPVTARGTAPATPDEELWILVRPPDGVYYTTGRSPERVDERGDWSSSRMKLGRGQRDVGLEYDLVAVLVPARANQIRQALEQVPGEGRSARFVDLPRDVARQTSVRIKLSGYEEPRPPGPSGEPSLEGDSRSASPVPSTPLTCGVTPVEVGAPTVTEIQGSLGAPTFSDPRRLCGPGPRVPPSTRVQVACRLYAPAPPSVLPDGYWYLLADGPAAGRYAAANTFLNGDAPGAGNVTNTDMRVPVCR